MERNIRLDWSNLIYEAIKRRKQQNLTQKQLAILVGVSGPTVNSFEQGKTTVSLESCLKILRFLGLLEESLGLYDSSIFEESSQKNVNFNPYLINFISSHVFKERTENAFRLSKAYLDKNFKKEFFLENSFFSRLWELFICDTLLQSNAAELVQKTNGKGPDFVVQKFLGSKNLYIECVCPQDADKKIKSPLVQGKRAHYIHSEEKNMQEGLETISVKSEDYDGFILSRYTSSIHDKSKKFQKSYPFTQDHFRVLCVSGCVLALLKTKNHNASYTLSTMEEFRTAMQGERTYFYDKQGGAGYRGDQVAIIKGDTFMIGGHEDLQTFDAIIFSDAFPFITSTSDNFYTLWFKENVSQDFIRKLEGIFQA